jgi:hypothetical protein
MTLRRPTVTWSGESCYFLLREVVAQIYTYHMQQMSRATNSDGETPQTTPDELAMLALETIPTVMRAIRTMMRAEGKKDLTVPQFRALGYIDRHRGASLKDVAEHLGIPMSGASRLVDKLVNRKLVTRTQSHPESATRRQTATRQSAPAYAAGPRCPVPAPYTCRTRRHRQSAAGPARSLQQRDAGLRRRWH